MSLGPAGQRSAKVRTKHQTALPEGGLRTHCSVFFSPYQISVQHLFASHLVALPFSPRGSGFSVRQLGVLQRRLVLKPDNTVRVEIDEENVYEGSLKEDWEVLKPKEL